MYGVYPGGCSREAYREASIPTMVGRRDTRPGIPYPLYTLVYTPLYTLCTPWYIHHCTPWVYLGGTPVTLGIPLGERTMWRIILPVYLRREGQCGA